MNKLEKQILELQKRVTSLENQVRQDANLSDIRSMLAELVRSMKSNIDTSSEDSSSLASIEDMRPPSHITQTRYRVV